MSPNTANSLVHDLVEMAKAMEQLPVVQEELTQTKHANTELLERIQSLELRIIDYKNSVDEKLALVRKVEAERDEAIRSFLDADDRTKRALDFVKSTFGSAGSLIQALEPPTPTPVVVPADAPATIAPSTERSAEIMSSWAERQPTDAPTQGQSDHPLPHSNAPSMHSTPSSFETPTMVPSTSPAPSADHGVDPGPMGIDFHGDASNVDSVSSGPQGERAADPTVPVQSSNDGLSVASSGVTSTENASVSTTTDTSTVVDDVGYHNEPKVQHPNDWTQWDAWALRMNDRYGAGTWPRRN